MSNVKLVVELVGYYPDISYPDPSRFCLVLGYS